MFKGKIQFKILRNTFWISIFVLLSIIIIFVSASVVLYNHTVDLLTENLRDRLLTISITAAVNISSKDLQALQKEEDWKKPEWARVVNVLHKAKYSNKDIVFMYIFRYTKDPNDDPKNLEFVGDADSLDPYANVNNDPTGATVTKSSCSKCIDSNRDGKIEPNGPDKLQWPGQPWPEGSDIPEAYQAYSGPLTVKNLYTDEYGTVLTGYAPIKDENGNTVAVLATDIKADDFFSITRQTLYPFLAFIFFLVSVIIIFNILLIRSVRREVRQREQIAKMAEDVRRAYAIEKKANAELEQLDKVKDQFLMTTQHNLRTPLTSIMGYSDLILNGTYGKQNKKTVKVIQKFQMLGKGMIKMVNDFLDASAFQLGKDIVSLKPDVELFPLVTDVIDELKFKAENKKITLTLEKPDRVFKVKADPEKLKAAIFNVIDNSIKYTMKGGVKVEFKNHDSVKIIVSDTGIGIAPDHLKNLFTKMFERGANAKNITGSGVGLYLSYQIIKAHNGKLWAESEGEGKGSVFHIELPL